MSACNSIMTHVPWSSAFWGVVSRHCWVSFYLSIGSPVQPDGPYLADSGWQTLSSARCSWACGESCLLDHQLGTALHPVSVVLPLYMPKPSVLYYPMGHKPVYSKHAACFIICLNKKLTFLSTGPTSRKSHNLCRSNRNLTGPTINWPIIGWRASASFHPC